MTGIYKWSINGTPVKPDYKNDLAKDIEPEGNEMFFREKLSSKLKFKGLDYIFLDESAFDTEFVLLCERYVSSAWSTYYTGKFMKTDCEWNIDHQIVSASITTVDNYVKILAGQEKEYDLIKLNPAISQLWIDKRPLIQLYSLGGDIVSCFLGGMYWEQQAAITDATDADLTGTYKFVRINWMMQATLVRTGTPSLADGLYMGKRGYDYLSAFQDTFVYQDYTVISTHYTVADAPLYSDHWEYTLIRNSDSVHLAQSGAYGALVDSGDITFTGLVTGFDNITATVQRYGMYMRYLLDLPITETFMSTAIYNLPVDDIVADNRNYRTVCPYGYDNIVLGEVSSTPTQWGKYDDTHYFKEPTSAFPLLWNKAFPVARSQWVNTSVWFHYEYNDGAIEPTGRSAFLLRNAYKVSDAIAALLTQIDTGLTHVNSDKYSQFMYDQTANPVYGDWFEYMIAPKSNVLDGEYDQPAMKAPVTLRSIFDMLRDTAKLYWFIETALGIDGVVDGTKMLRIEHISYFKNGGSYTVPTPTDPSDYGADLVNEIGGLQDKRNMKFWEFGRNQYTYDKLDMPQRYEFKWMDKCSKGHEGYPIEIISKYVQEGKIENIQVGQFTSDIDYLLTNPETVSKDGFALFGAIISTEELHGGQYALPYWNINIERINNVIQNGFLSFMYLAQFFYIYDLPASRVMINLQDYFPLEGISRKKKQVVKYPSDTDPSYLDLIKTSLGDGQVDKISINLSSRMNTITLKYDTE